MNTQHPKTISTFLLVLVFLLNGCNSLTPPQETTPTTKAEKPSNSLALFAWPFLPPSEMQYRGGTTAGAPVTLATEASSLWQDLQAADIDKMEKDRRAILAMQGAYRTSFQFIETAGFAQDYKPAQPYFSWGTENIHLLEDRGDFISLQHTLVMYFQQEDGAISEPMIMKHWRQDWRYEQKRFHEYSNDNQWSALTLTAAESAGKWVQSVYQVDDSPRYQVAGEWQHGAGFSSWYSEMFTRPLPRREFSVRDDYNMLEGIHQITITPRGWIHEQKNQKLLRENGKDVYLAAETGFDRYERIVSPDLATQANKYWDTTGEYWQAVRNQWNILFSDNPSLTLKKRHEGKKLYEYHFSDAYALSKETSKIADYQEKAKAIINEFVVITQ